jgi:hypothetical protein
MHWNKRLFTHRCPAIYTYLYTTNHSYHILDLTSYLRLHYIKSYYISYETAGDNQILPLWDRHHLFGRSYRSILLTDTASNSEQWYSTGGTRRHLRGYVDYTIFITCIMYQQLWGYKVEEKLYLGVREPKRLNTTASEDTVSNDVINGELTGCGRKRSWPN